MQRAGISLSWLSELWQNNVNEYHGAQTTQKPKFGLKFKLGQKQVWNILQNASRHPWPNYNESPMLCSTWKLSDYTIIPWYQFYDFFFCCCDFERFGLESGFPVFNSHCMPGNRHYQCFVLTKAISNVRDENFLLLFSCHRTLSVCNLCT